MSRVASTYVEETGFGFWFLQQQVLQRCTQLPINEAASAKEWS